MPIEPGIELTKDNVLSRITEEEIFERYLGIVVDISKSYTNPLRVDKDAGCRFYYDSRGRLKFKDFSKGYNWDCFNVVEFRYGLSFIESLRKIVKDFSIRDIEVKQNNVTNSYTFKEREDIKVSVREWSQWDIKFWKFGNITLNDLKLFEVYPCKALWISGEYYKVANNDPCYCYYFGNGLYKIYFPKRKTHRFFQNVYQHEDFLQGVNKLPERNEYLLITKSYKDVISLYTFGVISCAVLSETHFIKQETYEKLLQRFPIIFTLFDNDDTGRRITNFYNSKYGTIPLIFPKTWQKDWYDNVKLYGVEKMKEVIQIYKDKYSLVA